MTDMGRWNRRFIDLAATVAQWSKDSSTKCGCVIVRPNKSIASLGFNGFPQGIEDQSVFLEALEADPQARVKKLERIIHAEMNALLFLPERGPCLTMYVYPMLPCHRCAVHIIQAGIAKVIAPVKAIERWQGSMDLSRKLFAEAKVIVEEIDYETTVCSNHRELLIPTGERSGPGTISLQVPTKATRGPDYDL